MINTSYSSQQLLSLLGRQPGGRAGLDASTKAAAELGKRTQEVTATERKAQASPVSSAPVGPDGQAIPTHEDIDRLSQEMRALCAKVDAAEDAFEAENGFRRKTTPQTVSMYSRAASGDVNGYKFTSHQEAAEWATGIVSRVHLRTLDANWDTAALNDPSKVKAVAQEKGLTSTQATAMLKDEGQAAHMNATVESLVFGKTFEVTGGALLGKQDGYEFLNNVEVRYKGKLVLTVEGNGEKVTQYDEGGNATQTDAMFRFDKNRPGAFAPLS